MNLIFNLKTSLIDEFVREAHENMQRQEMKKSNKLNVIETKFEHLDLNLNKNKGAESKTESVVASQPSVVSISNKSKETESINDWLDDLLN